jgi:enoyl-CoA hydratase/carnithine racemase
MNAREPDAGTTPVLAIEGPRATIRLNRPRQLNKITPEDIAALLERRLRSW